MAADESPDGGAVAPSRLGVLRAGLRLASGGRTHLLLVAATLVEFAAVYVVAYLLRFEFTLPDTYDAFIWGSLPWVVLIKLVAFYSLGIYRILWAYVGLRDLYRVLWATAVSAGAVVVTNHMFFPFQLVPRSVLLMDGVLTFLAVGGLFGVLRSIHEVEARPASRDLEPVLIVGAGDAGDALFREFQRNPSIGVRVVGFLDDKPSKLGLSLRGVSVLGRVSDATRIAGDSGVRKAYIAVPSASGATIRPIVNRLLDAGLAIKILPSLATLRAGSGFATQLRDVSIEDLLRREPVKLDTTAISAFIRDKVVLVTGAAGSIGSELCRQILEYHPAHLVALDCAETPLCNLMIELGLTADGRRVTPELADVTDEDRVREIFAKHTPRVVLHAAALKHVPILEAHPREAIRVNVAGTRNVALEASASHVEAFLLISTDKAVNPTSVMGATKRVAELLVREIGASSATKAMSVRFGNVLGSNGSVVPVFKAQIAAGGPVTVTHPEMRRYFMTIPEAVQLVLQAAVLGRGGEVFVLDMGEPVCIADMATDMIRLSGLVPGVDVKIEFTGIRPGEKLFEELKLDSETVDRTPHQKVFCLKDKSVAPVPAVSALVSEADSGAAFRAGAEGLVELMLSRPAC